MVIAFKWYPFLDVEPWLTVVQTVGFGWFSQFGKTIGSRTKVGPRRTVATLNLAMELLYLVQDMCYIQNGDGRPGEGQEMFSDYDGSTFV